MIKNIVFDMGGVLIEYNPEKFLDSYSLSKEDKQILLEKVFHSYQWILMDYGRLSTYEGIYEMQKGLPAHLKGFAVELINNWPALSKPIEGMYELCCKLKDAGYEIFLLSNAANNQPEYWKRYPYYFLFDKKVISFQEHTVKPERAIYEVLLNRYDLKAEECLFIDDSQANVAGAIMANMNGVVFHNIDELKEQLKEFDIQL